MKCLHAAQLSFDLGLRAAHTVLGNSHMSGSHSARGVQRHGSMSLQSMVLFNMLGINGYFGSDNYPGPRSRVAAEAVAG